MATRKTHAGIDWVGSSLGNAAKIIVDRVTMKFFEEKGYDPTWDVRGNWDKVARGSGVLSKSRFDDLGDLFGVLLPDFVDYYKEASTHRRPMGEVLAHRGRWTVQNDETSWLRKPAFAPFYRMVRDAVDKTETITPEMRFQAHERVVCQMSGGQSGVYVRLSPHCPEVLYLGGSGDVEDRNPGHYNSPLYLSRVYCMPNKTYSHQIEASLFDRLEESGLVVHKKNPNGPPGKQGALTLAKGVKPLELLDGWVDSLYRHFCRAKLGTKQM